MTMYQFMVIVYIVLNVLFRALRRGGGNNGRY